MFDNSHEQFLQYLFFYKIKYSILLCGFYIELYSKKQPTLQTELQKKIITQPKNLGIIYKSSYLKQKRNSIEYTVYSNQTQK